MQIELSKDEIKFIRWGIDELALSINITLENIKNSKHKSELAQTEESNKVLYKQVMALRRRLHKIIF